MTVQKVELIDDEEGFVVTEDGDGDLRVSSALFARYKKAGLALLAIEKEIEEKAERPVYVTADQEEQIRAIAQPGTWIVVRELPQPAQDAPYAGISVADWEAALAAVLLPPVTPPPPAPEPPAAPAGPPVRPQPGRCHARGGLPHANLRFVITEELSVYAPGRIRVDGLCQCGHREPDVKCPHQKQKLNSANQKACAMCNAVLGSSAGAIDNRNPAWGGRSPNGAADPNIRLPVPAGAQDAPRDAYRAPGA